VRVVVAAPEKLLVNGQLPKRHMRLATEYVALAEKWVKAHGVDAEIYKTFGSTEVFPPDDAEVRTALACTSVEMIQSMLIARLIAHADHRRQHGHGHYPASQPAGHRGRNHQVLHLPLHQPHGTMSCGRSWKL
jgi:hypothetical protein